MTTSGISTGFKAIDINAQPGCHCLSNGFGVSKSEGSKELPLVLNTTNDSVTSAAGGTVVGSRQVPLVKVGSMSRQ